MLRRDSSRLRGSGVAVAVAALATCSAALAAAGRVPDGLLFHASFDHNTTDADFAAGSKACGLDANLDLRSAEGIVGNGLLQEPRERCTYQVPGNLDTSAGSFSVWVKPLSWEGHSKKFRHFMSVTGVPDYRMLFYLYPVGDEAVFCYIQVHPKTPRQAVWRAGTPVDMLKQNQWTHLVSTWNSRQVRVYANGKRVGEGLVAAPLPKADKGVFTVCPVEFWRHAQWSDPGEKTICDEVRVFDHALSDDEVLDLYAAEVPGGVADLKPSLTLEMKPDYFAKAIAVTLRGSHFDDAWQARAKAGAKATLTLTDPKGRELLSRPVGLPATTVAVPVESWADGDYVARARLDHGRDALEAVQTLAKPATPWLPRQTDWRAERVLPPWKRLQRRGQAIEYWNGEVSLPGAFPEQITSRGQPVLAGPIRLTADGPARWDTPEVVEDKPHRVVVRGKGRLGPVPARYETLMEFDGLIRVDVALSPPAGGATIQSLAIEIPIRKDVAAWYRCPKCADWAGAALDEDRFKPYGWLGNEDRGLSWFMESDANWRVGAGQPYLTLRPTQDAVVARLLLISEPTRIDRETAYTVGFEATPVRPLDPDLYDHRWAGGPQVKGVNMFVYGWGKQISYLNARLLARDPAHQRAFVDKWRAKGMETRSYSCLQCTANTSPEYRFFGEEWNQPYGSTFSGYKRVPDDAPYSMVPVCPRSSFADFLVWCVKEHVRNDWGGGIYTDIDGAKPCDNARHGCGFTDAFGRRGRAWPLYAHRGMSRRIYEACHAAGKAYFSHSHSNWYSLFNAFNDGWAPGEQYSSAVMKNPYFYMEEMPDRVWRSEFYSPTTGVATYLLPQIGRLGDRSIRKQRGPSESCVAAAMVYGAPLWASLNKEVTEEFWQAQVAFGMKGARFMPFWRQRELASSNPKVRLSLWKKPGRWLVAVANFTPEDQPTELRPAAAGPNVKFEPAWLADGLIDRGGKAAITVPAKRGALIVVEGVE